MDRDFYIEVSEIPGGSMSKVVILFFYLNLIIISSVSNISANEFGVNLYGFSYHILNEYQSRDRLNEFNLGIGARATFGRPNTSNVFIEVGSFKDTFENQAKYMSIGFLLKIIDKFKVGLNASAYSTESTRGGEVFFAPIPIATYTIGPVTANGVFLPKYGRTNPYNTIGFYLTVRMFKGSSRK